DLPDFVQATLDDPEAAPELGVGRAWMYAEGPLRCAANLTSPLMVSADVVLVLDGRDEAVAEPGYKNVWHEWLRLSNLLGFRRTAPAIGAVTLAMPSVPVIVEPGALGKHLRPEWQDILDLATNAERELLAVLAEVDEL
ncbi:hypothetical protein, partial [Escherichia coli]|uniref:hypothetical protein n=1 Tax=Escherichia coli TaxID=562 RepID=UPI0032E44684